MFFFEGLDQQVAKSRFRRRAAQLLVRGKKKELRAEFIDLAADAAMKDGEAAIESLADEHLDVMLAPNKKVVRGKFNDLK